jgi:RNA polymerase sigma factor (TIGR02999 family)
MKADQDLTSITSLLQAWRQGDSEALSQLLLKAHGELVRMAASRLRGGETPSLAPGDLLHESLLKVMHGPPDWHNRAHFFATVATAMRSVLVDHARARKAEKRGGAWTRVTFSVSDVGEESMVADLLTLDEVLDRLASQDERAAQIVQLTYFAGLSREDIATVLELSIPTVDRELRFSRAWLAQELRRDGLEA